MIVFRFLSSRFLFLYTTAFVLSRFSLSFNRLIESYISLRTADSRGIISSAPSSSSFLLSLLLWLGRLIERYRSMFINQSLLCLSPLPFVFSLLPLSFNRLVEGYISMRTAGSRGSSAAIEAGRKVVTATPRQLESLIRLSEV